VVAVSLLGLTPIASDFDTSGVSVLFAVAMSSPRQGWAVGSFERNQGGQTAGIVWADEGGRWAEEGRWPWDLNGVAALPDGQAWAVGDSGHILHEIAGTGPR